MDADVRLAVPADAAALVALRAAMFSAIGDDVGGDDAPWRAAARVFFERSLAGDRVLAVVADVPDAGPVACAIAVLHERAPSPTDLAPVSGHVSTVSTLSEHRRRGYARACLELLLARLDERGVHRAELNATSDGEPLYRALGFRPAPHPALRRTSPSR